MQNKPSTNKKKYALLLIILGGLTCLFPFGVDLYLPAMPTIAKSMGEPLNRIEMSLSAYTFTFALSLLIFGPIADRIGRLPLIRWGTVAYSLAYLVTIFAENANQLIFTRILQSAAGSAIMAAVPAMVHDTFKGKDFARAMSTILFVTMVAPMVAPFIGGYLIKWLSWRSLFLCLSLIGIIGFLMSSYLKETSSVAQRQYLSVRQLVTNYGKIITHKQASKGMLINGLFLSGLFAFITGSSTVYIKFFGVSPQNYPLLFALNVAAISTGNFLNIRLLNYFSVTTLIRLGATITTLAGLGLMTAAITETKHLFYVVIPIMTYAGCMGLIGPNSNMIAVHYFPKISGSANALAGVTRFGMAGISSFTVSQLHDGTVRPTAIAIMSCSIAMLLMSLFLKNPENSKGSSETNEANHASVTS